MKLPARRATGTANPARTLWLMEFRVLGPLQLVADGHELELTSVQRRRLLAVLLARAGQVVPVEDLVDALWGEDPPVSAQQSLHSHVSRLRGTLASVSGDRERVVTRGAGYVLVLDETDEIDAVGFEREIGRAREVAGQDPAQALDLLEGALARWRGPPYANVASAVQGEVVRLERLYRSAQELRIDVMMAVGQFEAAIGELEAHCREQPLDEPVVGQLMLALSRSGRQSEALECYRAYQVRLAEGLGVDPSPWLQQRYTGILRQEPELTRSTDEVVDRGWEADAATPAARAEPSPRALTTLVGRDAAVAAVDELLGRAALVTLIGPGGVGKTRLAHAVVDRASARYDDAAAVALAPIRDAGALEPAVAAALGVVPGGDVRVRLVSALQGRRLLLLIDNCEHLLPDVAVLIAHVLDHCPSVTVLATSRERLAVDGEHLWTVRPLEIPGAEARSADHVLDSPAGRLFCDRAAAAQPDWSLTADNAAAVATICRRLDGVPLALELAAARVAALPAHDIAVRLDERFQLLTTGPRREHGRHRTLREVVDWSYGLLSEEEAQLFDRLSVFAGGFTLDAAERVAGGGAGATGSVVGDLASLIDSSMVVRSGARYDLLETLRVYGGERLANRGESDRLRGLHAGYYAGLTQQAGPAVCGADEGTWVARLDQELGNLRAAHRWAMAADDGDLALRLSAPLAYYADWWLVDEVTSWAEEATAVPGAADHPLLPLAFGLAARGAGNRGELDRSAALARQGLAGVPDGDPRRIVALKALSLLAFYDGRLDESDRLEEQILALAEAAGDAYNLAYVWVMRALIATYRGDLPAATAAAQRAGAHADELGNTHLRAMACYAHGEALAEHEPDTALGWVDDAITLARDVGARLPEAVALVTRSSLHGARGEPTVALESFREAILHLRRGGDWTHQWTALRNLVFLLARLAADEPAAVLIGAIETTTTAAEVYGADAQRLRATAHDVRTRLGERRFADAHARGSGMSDPEAVDAALTAIDHRLAGTPN